MDTIPTRLIVNKEEMTVNLPSFAVLVHQPGIRVDVPDSIEINGRTTIDVMSKMSQRAWTHISTGQLFQHLFRKAFPAEDCEISIPETIEELNQSDFGVIHVAGMIVQGCEAIFEGKTKIFLRNPEDNLHPKTERRIVGMIKDLAALAGGQDVQIEEIK